MRNFLVILVISLSCFATSLLFVSVYVSLIIDWKLILKIITLIYLQGKDKVKDREALKENNELLKWLLLELFKIGKHPHPHSRQVSLLLFLNTIKNSIYLSKTISIFYLYNDHVFYKNKLQLNLPKGYKCNWSYLYFVLLCLYRYCRPI